CCQTEAFARHVSNVLEYVDVSPPQRNWKGIAISLLVIVVVCSLISLSVVILTPTDLPDTSRSRLTVADLYQPEFSVHDPEATWVSESEVVYRNRDGHVVKFNFKLNETELILSNKTFVSAPISLLSSCLKPGLSLQVYRHSYTASYSVYNIYTREVWELNPPEVKNAMLQHASWGKQGHQLIYIFENNIYYQSDVRSNSLRITSSGMEEVIFNGLADWLYEEEILNSHLAHWWSPDSERLAFLTINDSLVPKMGIPQFTGSTYPRGLQYPYPMVSISLLTFMFLKPFVLLDNDFHAYNNSPLRAALQSRRLTSTEIQKITIENYGINDQHSADGAPGQQAVTDQFHLGWDSVLSGSEHVIVARLDGRGTGFGGQRLLHQVYHRLGTVDTEDQLAALEYLPFIDRNRVGVFGEGYGGFLTLMMLKSTDQLIKCAAVQAPIIDWSLYASAFSERYLGSPLTEENRYQASKVLPNQRGLPGGTLFLAHGTADANVHFQHSAELIKHFIKIGANYTMQIFPDEGHFLSTRSRIQLTHSLIGYFRGCLLDTLPPLDQRDDD
uniref:Inactive dipeptidyl peptidase 10 n=1 Tax=Oryzias sinensis TaxID=183150 RepID=A0A8C8A1L8_9TELE